LNFYPLSIEHPSPEKSRKINFKSNCKKQSGFAVGKNISDTSNYIKKKIKIKKPIKMHCITRINNLVYATFVPHKVNIDVGVVFDGESITFYTKKSEILYGASLFISTKKLFFFNSVTPFFHPFFISISTFFLNFILILFLTIIQVVFKPTKSNRSH